MDTVTGDNYLKAFRKNITELLESVSDPASNYQHQLVYQTHPDVKSVEFDEFPIIVLEDFGLTDFERSVDYNTVMFNGTVEVIIKHKDESAEDKQIFDELSQNVHKTLTKGKGLNEVKIAQSSIERDQRITGRDAKDQRIQVREIEASVKIQVKI